MNENDSENPQFLTDTYTRYIRTKVLLDKYGADWGVLSHHGAEERYSIELEGSRGQELCSAMAQLGWQLKDTFSPLEGNRGLRFDSLDNVVEQTDVDVEALLNEIEENA